MLVFICFEFVDLNVFMIIVWCCSFCYLVQELGVSILVLSYSMCNFEVWFGVKLFNCISCLVVLIDVGSVLVVKLEDGFQVIGEVFGEFDVYCILLVGWLCLNVLCDVLWLLLGLVFRCFIEVYLDL